MKDFTDDIAKMNFYFQQLRELAAQGNFKILSEEHEFENLRKMVIDTSKEGISTGKRGRKEGSRKGNIITIECLDANIIYIDEDNRLNNMIVFNLESLINCKLYNYTWGISSNSDNTEKNGYARAYVGRDDKGNNKYIYMHRLILKEYYNIDIDLEDAQLADHMNGNKLWNKIRNLKPATYKENANNRNQNNWIENIDGIFHCTFTNIKYSSVQWDFDKFGIEFNAEYPEPTTDFESIKNKTEIYLNEYNDKIKKLINLPSYQECWKKLVEEYKNK